MVRHAWGYRLRRSQQKLMTPNYYDTYLSNSEGFQSSRNMVKACYREDWNLFVLQRFPSQLVKVYCAQETKDISGVENSF